MASEVWAEGGGSWCRRGVASQGWISAISRENLRRFSLVICNPCPSFIGSTIQGPMSLPSCDSHVQRTLCAQLSPGRCPLPLPACTCHLPCITYKVKGLASGTLGHSYATLRHKQICPVSGPSLALNGWELVAELTNRKR